MDLSSLPNEAENPSENLIYQPGRRHSMNQLKIKTAEHEALLKNFTLSELTEEARGLGIAGYSSLKKPALVATIARKWAERDCPPPVPDLAWN
jgi:hypothetical protein